LYQLNQIYDELCDDIWTIAELHRRMKGEGLKPQQVSRLLKTITTLERRNIDLEGEQARLDLRNKQAAKAFQHITDLIQKYNKTLQECEYAITQQKREIERLNLEKARLEYSIDSIRLNDVTCINVKQIVEQELENKFAQPRQLIKNVLDSLFESSRKHPGKLLALYYNNSNIESEDERLLLDEAEQMYNNIVNTVTIDSVQQIPKPQSQPQQQSSQNPV
jgi:hypothetical protein